MRLVGSGTAALRPLFREQSQDYGMAADFATGDGAFVAVAVVLAVGPIGADGGYAQAVLQIRYWS